MSKIPAPKPRQPAPSHDTGEEAYPQWTVAAGVILLILGISGICADLLLINLSIATPGPGSALHSMVAESSSLSELQMQATYLQWQLVRHTLELGLDIAAIVLAALFLRKANIKLWLPYLVLGSSIVLSIAHIVALAQLDKESDLVWPGAGIKVGIVLFIYYSNKKHALPSYS